MRYTVYIMKKYVLAFISLTVFAYPIAAMAQYYPNGYATTTSQASFGGTATVTGSGVQATSASTDGEGKESTCIDLKSEKLGFGSTDTETSGEVSAVQDFLIFKGLLDGSPTGYYGFKTYRAVLTYQKSKGIDQVGRVGPLTKKFIKEESCGAVVSASTSSSNTTTSSGAAWGGTATAAASNQATSWGTAASWGGSATVSSSGSCASAVSCTTGFPYVFENQTVANGNYLTRVRLSLRGTSAKILGTSLLGCARPSTASGCTTDGAFTRVKDMSGWSYNSSLDTYSIDKDVTAENLPNVEYSSFIKTFDNQKYEIRWKAVAAGSVTTGSTNASTYQGAVFGAGSSGVPGSQPVSYSWVVYSGSQLGQQSATNLGFSEPTTPCTSANSGATYYLGLGSSGSQVVATCTPSNQSVLSPAQVNQSTLNTGSTNSSASFGGSATVTGGTNNSTGSQSQASFGGTATTGIQSQAATSQASFGPSNSYVRGTFVSDGKTVEWACGSAGAPAPSDATGWVAQESGCYHRVAQ